MIPTKSEPDIVDPVQDRSRRTQKALLRAAMELVGVQSVDRLSVAEIAQKAGVSIGGFYARYQSKQALLRDLHQVVLDDLRAELDRRLGDLADHDTVTVVVRAYIETMILKFQQHRTLLRSVRTHARGGDEWLAGRVREFNDYAHGRLRELVLHRRGEIHHADPGTAFEFGLFMVSAGAREAILADALAAYPIKLSSEELVNHLTELFTGYLGIRGIAR